MAIRRTGSQTLVNRGVTAAAATPVNIITGSGGGGATVNISSIQIANSTFVAKDDLAIDTAGGYMIINGTGFQSGAVAYVQGTAATSTSFVSASRLNVTVPALSSGLLDVYVVNTDGSGSIYLRSLNANGTPSWTTTSPLPTQVSNTAFAINLSAVGAAGDGTITYGVSSGSSLPSGTFLASNGYFYGTLTGIETETTYSFNIDAIDAQNQETARTFNITFLVADVNFKNTVLLLNGETTGANSSNTWLQDISNNKFNLTVNGDSSPSKLSPYYTLWSVAFNSSTPDYLALPFNSINLDANDFTLEAWVYLLDRDGIYTILNSQTNAATASGSSYGLTITQTNGYLEFNWYVGGGVYTLTGSTSIPLNTWNHVALVRTGGTMSIYLNGTRQATRSDMGTNSINAGSASYEPYIGRNGNYYPFKGYISNLRIIRGAGGYTATNSTITVPTSALTAVSNTILLTCNTNGFVDANTTPKTITVNGSPKVTMFAPLSENDRDIGSGYFDGTGDYLSSNVSAIGTNDFTVEYWSYLTAHSGSNGEGGYFQISSVSGGLSTSYTEGITAVRSSPGAGRVLQVNIGGTSVSTSYVPRLNEWFHTAITRSSNTVRVFVNGTLVSTPTTISANLTGTFCSIGGYYSTSYLMTGYIADFRLLIGTAQYTANTTPPTAPLTAVANTNLLTLQNHLGENNRRFVDQSNVRHIVTRTGNSTQGTFSPFSQTGWSTYFDGSGDSFSVSTSTVLDLNGAIDFTIEAWVYLTGYGSTSDMSLNIVNKFSGAGGLGYTYGIIGGGADQGKIRFYGTNGSINTLSTNVIPLNSWNHIAIVKNGTTYTHYLNGAVNGSQTTATTLTASTNALVIGDYGYSDDFLGYMSNLRITKNGALYTSTFNPPTSPLSTSVSVGTVSLLTFQSNRFIDNSSNGFTLTPSGTPSVQAFSPFLSSNNYTTTVVGGSAYFDGTSDYIEVPSDSAFALGSAFTLEAWVYPTTNMASGAFFISGTGTGTWQFGHYTSNTFGLASNGVAWRITSSKSLTIGAWNHCVFVRSGTGAGQSSLFLNGERVGNGQITDTFTSNQTARTGDLLAGYITGVRVIKGTALYDPSLTTCTVPTAPLSPTANTVLLMNFTNSGIIDYTSKNNIEAVGDARIRTDIVKNGSRSLFFDGTGDYLLMPDNPDLELESGDFTIEAWVYLTALNTERHIISKNASAATCGAYVFQVNSSNIVKFYASNNTSSWVINAVGTATISQNTWTHVAVTRSGSTFTVWVNGTSSGTATSSLVLMNQTVRTAVGANENGSFPWLGYIDDLRITKGVARYTTSFTPPTLILTK